MRINWGHGLFIAMALFIVFIVMLSVRLMTRDSSVEYKDYYQRGLQYDRQMAMERRAAPYADSIKVTYNQSKLKLFFPRSLDLPINELKILMYRPSSSKLDQHIHVDEPILNHELQFPVKALVKGNWQARLTWKDHKDSTFYAEQFMFIE